MVRNANPIAKIAKSSGDFYDDSLATAPAVRRFRQNIASDVKLEGKTVGYCCARDEAHRRD
jgi:hypothetical protein